MSNFIGYMLAALFIIIGVVLEVLETWRSSYCFYKFLVHNDDLILCGK